MRTIKPTINESWQTIHSGARAIRTDPHFHHLPNNVTSMLGYVALRSACESLSDHGVLPSFISPTSIKYTSQKVRACSAGLRSMRRISRSRARMNFAKFGRSDSDVPWLSGKVLMRSRASLRTGKIWLVGIVVTEPWETMKKRVEFASPSCMFCWRTSNPSKTVVTMDEQIAAHLYGSNAVFPLEISSAALAVESVGTNVALGRSRARNDRH